MSSRLMPPKVGSRSWQTLITSSGFVEKKLNEVGATIAAVDPNHLITLEA